MLELNTVLTREAETLAALVDKALAATQKDMGNDQG